MTPDTEKLNNRTLQDLRQVKETYIIQKFPGNMVASGAMKDDAISCCILICFTSVTI